MNTEQVPHLEPAQSEQQNDLIDSWQSVAHFRLARYRFVLRAETPIELPPYKGSAFRGCFGHALKRAVCTSRERDCPSCLMRSRCLYPYVFESGVESSSPTAKAVPHPFVLIPPMTPQRSFRPGDRLDLDLVLMGKAIPHLPYFIYTVEEMGRLGLGREKGRYRLAEVLEIRPDTGERVIYTETDHALREPGPPVTGRELASRLTGPASFQECRRLTLEFLTPTRLTFQEQLIDHPEFHILMSRLIGRLIDLSRHHHEARMQVNHTELMARAKGVRLVKHNLTWYDWERYSNRQQTRMKLGGILGTASYEGELGEFLPFLALGEWVHLGKGTSFGLGGGWGLVSMRGRRFNNEPEDFGLSGCANRPE